jgi:hypothetical protein
MAGGLGLLAGRGGARRLACPPEEPDDRAVGVGRECPANAADIADRLRIALS